MSRSWYLQYTKQQMSQTQDVSLLVDGDGVHGCGRGRARYEWKAVEGGVGVGGCGCGRGLAADGLAAETYSVVDGCGRGWLRVHSR